MPQPKVDGAQTSPWSIGDLLRPQAFTHAVEQLELRETHISWVVLTGRLAYKIKKPVKLDFIDASSLEQRHRFCEEELRLNRRFAPELYLDLVAITFANGHAAVAGTGSIVDYAVQMQQFSASDELPALLARNEVSAEDIAALGELLGQFHMKATVAAPALAAERTDQMYDVVLGNLSQLSAHLGPTDPSQTLSRLIEWTHESANALEPTFQERERGGYVRECHGDLHAANVVRSHGRLVPFDCIEFDPKLRWIDVLSDVAFLVMDLTSHQRADLAFILLSHYLEVTGDYEGVRLLPFYAVYRALVRAKVDALSAAQVTNRAEEFRQRLQQRIRAAVSWTTPPRAVLILMHGPSGSGKSWLSGKLIPELRAIRIRSDLERKRLARVAPTQSASAAVREGIYSPEFNHRTYSHLANCAASCLRSGLSVIVDAAFLEQTDREVFRALASQLRAPCIIVSCQADPVTLAARIIERSGQRRDPSDADLTILNAQLRDIQPFTPEEQRCVVSIDTSEPDAARRVVAAITAQI